MMDSKELRWKEIPNTKGVYEVSTNGDVRRVISKLIPGKTPQRLAEPKMIATSYRNRGYKAFNLKINNKTINHSVHILVLEAFVGPRPNGYECAHLNGKRDDNRLENLKWVSRKENHSHKWLHGTHQDGDKCPSARLKSAQVYAMRLMYSFGARLCEIAAVFGEDTSFVYNCMEQGNNWIHLKDPNARLVEYNLELRNTLSKLGERK